MSILLFPLSFLFCFVLNQYITFHIFVKIFVYINFHYSIQRRFLVGCVMNQFVKVYVFVVLAHLSKVLCGNVHKNIFSPFLHFNFLSYPLFEQNKSRFLLIKGKVCMCSLHHLYFRYMGASKYSLPCCE